MGKTVLGKFRLYNNNNYKHIIKAKGVVLESSRPDAVPKISISMTKKKKINK